MKPVGGIVGTEWFESSLNRTNDFNLQGKFSHRENERFGLMCFSEKTGSQYYDTGSRALSITCDAAELPPKWHGSYFPSCKVKSHYRDNIVFEYYYALNYFPQWREIDSNLKALFDRFEQSTDTDSIK